MRRVIQQTDNYSRGWNSLFLGNVKHSISVVFKNEFLVKMSSNQFDLHFTVTEISLSLNFYYLMETDDRNNL